MIININDFGGGGKGLSFEIVESLPTEGKKGIIYLIESEDPSESDKFEEYIWVDGEWEKFGKMPKIDLEDYYTKEECDDKFLTEHQALKTINGETIVGEGDITIESGLNPKKILYMTMEESDDSYRFYPLNGLGYYTNIPSIPQIRSVYIKLYKNDGTYDTKILNKKTTCFYLSKPLDITQYHRWTISYLDTDSSDRLYSFDFEGTFNTSNKQDTLVSGTNIKTINGESVLGSGDFSFYTKDEIDTKIGIINNELENIIG